MTMKPEYLVLTVSALYLWAAILYWIKGQRAQAMVFVGFVISNMALLMVGVAQA